MELSSQGDMNRYNTYDLATSTQSGGLFWFIKQPLFRKVGVIFAAIIAVIFIFIAGYVIGRDTNKRYGDDFPTGIPYANLKWNGTCPEATTVCPESYQGIPPLILISLDGFRAEYLNRGLTPNLQAIRQCGSSVPNMYSCYPTKTFPNHYTIVTGLYPEFHGIIDNTMWDPERKALFKVGNSESMKSYWWGGEPIWITAQNQGKRSHCYFWPGSDVVIKGARPTVYRNYSSKVKFSKRVKTVLEWLDLPQNTRPHFITLYFNQPDKAGHIYGPNSHQVNQQLIEVDKLIGSLFYGLEQRGLLNCVNVIIVSDHGMTSINCNHVINLDRFVDSSALHTVLGANGRLKPRKQWNDTTVNELIKDLQCKNEHWRIYKKGQIPIRYHYSNNERIEPIVIDVDNGWTLLSSAKSEYCSGGKHGYDNYAEDMKAIFIAHGPSFKSNYTGEPFLNTELYELMSELLNITASPNNGTKGSLSYLLTKPQTLPRQVEPNHQEIGTVPTDELERKIRLFAANCTCSQGEETYNQTDVENVSFLRSLHLPFGIPQTHEINGSHILLHNTDYISSYDTKYRLPMWSSFTLSRKVEVRNIENCWRGDARIPFKDTSTCGDYNTPKVSSAGILQEALFPPTFASDGALNDSHLVTNSVPKSGNYTAIIEPNFNRLLSLWIQTRGSINVIAGPAFDVLGNGIYPGIANIMKTHEKYGPLVMPTHYFYIISWCRLKEIQIQNCNYSDVDAIAFLLPHIPMSYNCEPSESLIKMHLARVVDVEGLTGIAFFTKLPTEEAVRLRTSLPTI